MVGTQDSIRNQATVVHIFSRFSRSKSSQKDKIKRWHGQTNLVFSAADWENIGRLSIVGLTLRGFARKYNISRANFSRWPMWVICLLVGCHLSLFVVVPFIQWIEEQHRTPTKEKRYRCLPWNWERSLRPCQGVEVSGRDRHQQRHSREGV